MTDPKPAFLARIIAPLAASKPYLALIFISLLLWHIGVQILYAVIDGPGISGTTRANKFIHQMVFRLALFFLFAGILALILRMLDFKNISKDEPLISLQGLTPARIIRGAIMLALAMISFVWLQTNFMSVKTAIPEMMPFYLDEAGRRWDRALFFGRDPYTYFDWLYNAPKLFDWLDKTYSYWAALIAGTWVICFVNEGIERARRFQYIIAMILLWFIAGNVMATLMSSAGPCYYGDFTGDNAAYAPLMERLSALHSVDHVDAYSYQFLLMDMYNNPDSRFGGISAMPSLHVGSSLMLLIFFWKNVILRALLIAFNIAIYIGSIVLAWHYAVDGLIVLPAVFLCWWLAGMITRKIEARLSSAAPH